MKTEHILIIRFSAMGDVAMTVPVVYSLATQYPAVRITVLSRPFARPFFENLAPNVGFMEADIKNEYHGIKGLNALYRRLSAKHFTAIADLHSVLRSSYHKTTRSSYSNPHRLKTMLKFLPNWVILSNWISLLSLAQRKATSTCCQKRCGTRPTQK